MRNHYVDKKLLPNFALRKRFQQVKTSKNKKEKSYGSKQQVSDWTEGVLSERWESEVRRGEEHYFLRVQGFGEYHVWLSEGFTEQV